MPEVSLRDAPIVDEGECRLGLASYAVVLYEFMLDCETPMTVGLQGDWGIGKTSLIRMIQGRLSDGRGSVVPFIDFNTWQYSLFGQEELLGVACIKSLVEQISELDAANNKTLTEGVGKAARRLGRIAGAVASSVSVGVGPVSVDTNAVREDLSDDVLGLDIARLMVDFKEEFARLVELVLKNSGTDRLVIFIDDLDRVKPIRALELLEVLKNFLDVPGCVFVLAVDYEVVQMGMKEKLGANLQRSSGKSFFDKIINVPFNMPTTSYELGKYITDLIRESGFIKSGLEREDVQSFYEDITVVTVGRNPRNIKRVINYAKLLDKVRSKGISEYNQQHPNRRNKRKSGTGMQILYALMCMQIAWPELFRYFAANPTAETVKNLEDWEFLENLPEGRHVIARATDPQQIKSDIGAFVDELFHLLDANDDGEISHEEMQPVLEIMRFAKLTTATTAKTPLEQYMDAVTANGGVREGRFIRDVLMQTSWSTRTECELKKSGSRYWSIIINRKQVGSLVTLKSKRKGHFIFRLKEPPRELLDQVHSLLINNNHDWNAAREMFESVVKPLENISLTGFGDTRLDVGKLLAMDASQARAVLDWIYRAARALEFETRASLETSSRAPSQVANDSAPPSMAETSVVMVE